MRWAIMCSPSSDGVPTKTRANQHVIGRSQVWPGIQLFEGVWEQVDSLILSWTRGRELRGA